MLRQFISTGVMSLILVFVGCIMIGRTFGAPTTNGVPDGDLINMIGTGSSSSGSLPSITGLQQQHQLSANHNQIKRSWQNLQSAWGKRGILPDYNSIEDYQEQQIQPRISLLNDDDENETNMQGVQPQLIQQDHEYLMTPNIDEKRAWKSMNGAWGKRVNSDWNKFRGSWGKREPGWNNLKGLWGKRATWNKLSSAWGKRDTSAIPMNNNNNLLY